MARRFFVRMIKNINSENTMEKQKLISIFEISGSVLAMAYAMLIASNTGYEILGFSLLLISALLFAAWGVLDRRWAFLLLQVFYAVSAIIGLIPRFWMPSVITTMDRRAKVREFGSFNSESRPTRIARPIPVAPSGCT